MRLAGTPVSPQLSTSPEHLRAEQRQRQHRLRVRHEQDQLNADVLESGSGGDGSAVPAALGEMGPASCRKTAPYSPRFELARVLVRFNRVARFIALPWRFAPPPSACRSILRAWVQAHD